MPWGSWGVDVYLELRAQGVVRPDQRGALPFPEEVAEAIGRYGTSIEGASERDRMLRDSADIRAGAETGRGAFCCALIEIIKMKSGARAVDGWLAHLPPDIVQPFETAAERVEQGDHTRRLIDDSDWDLPPGRTWER